MFSKPERQKGFTIIEVLIVLAIAGMIMIIVFLAIPALQRNSRNHQRKQDASRIVAAINEYKAITTSGLPGSCANWDTGCFLREVPLSMYDNQSTTSNNVSFWNRSDVGPFQDGVDYQLDPNAANALERISARSFTKCNGSQMTGIDAQRQNIAAQFAIETGSDNILYCLEF